MALTIEPLLLKQLFDQLAAQTKESFDSSGFDTMSDYIQQKTRKERIGPRYLQDKYRQVIKALEEGKKEVRAYPNMMDEIAFALNYRNFSEFENTVIKPLDPILEQCEGNWWSIVRANAGEHILKAPVRIYKDKLENKMVIEMKGGIRLFTGQVQLRAGNLFCELDSGEDKMFYFIMKVGTNKHTRLLQGTFTGISSAGDPIAGRELFWREEKLPFEEMIWERLPIGTTMVDERFNKYLERYEGNCLKVGNVSVNDLSDLELNY